MSDTLRAAYDARVSRGEIERDPAQEAAIAAFERLAATLDAPAPERRRDRLGGLFGRTRPEPPEGTRGVYLWGGVGRGKSMLMDLFVASLEVPTRRVHFHAFMQEAHRGMDAARKRGVDDAIAPVADEVAEGLTLLALDEMQVSDIADAMIVGRLFQRLLGAGLGGRGRPRTGRRGTSTRTASTARSSSPFVRAHRGADGGDPPGRRRRPPPGARGGHLLRARRRRGPRGRRAPVGGARRRARAPDALGAGPHGEPAPAPRRRGARAFSGSSAAARSVRPTTWRWPTPCGC